MRRTTHNTSSGNDCYISIIRYWLRNGFFSVQSTKLFSWSFLAKVLFIEKVLQNRIYGNPKWFIRFRNICFFIWKLCDFCWNIEKNSRNLNGSSIETFFLPQMTIFASIEEDWQLLHSTLEIQMQNYCLNSDKSSAQLIKFSERVLYETLRTISQGHATKSRNSIKKRSYWYITWGCFIKKENVVFL